MQNTPEPKDLSDIQVDAVFLHGLIQGIGVIYDEVQTACTPASNACNALICETIEKASRLANDIHAVEARIDKMTRVLRRAEFKLQNKDCSETGTQPEEVSS